VRAVDILTKALPGTHEVDLNIVPQTKVDGIIELSYWNCFDIATSQFGRTMTLGFEVISNLIAKLIFSVYDDDSAQRYYIGKNHLLHKF
jgi:hypothetical protein